MDQALFDRVADERLSGFAVWVPKVGGTGKDVPEATRVAQDGRLKHYWDEGGRLMAQYTATLKLPEDAWDIYMIYEPGVRWESERPPEPDFWMHQLGRPDAPRVNGPYFEKQTFAAETSRRLNR